MHSFMSEVVINRIISLTRRAESMAVCPLPDQRRGAGVQLMTLTIAEIHAALEEASTGRSGRSHWNQARHVVI